MIIHRIVRCALHLRHKMSESSAPEDKIMPKSILCDTYESDTIIAKFAAVAHSYDDAALIEQELATRLLAKLTDIALQPKWILDLGCGTGMQSAALQALFPEANVIGLDLTFAMVNFAKNNNSLDYVCANAYVLPFAAQQFDLILANCCLQSINLQTEFWKEVHRVLNKDGLLLCSSFGPESFKEINIHDPLWIDMHVLGDFIQKVMRDPVIETEHLTFTYPDGEMLMLDLQDSGHNIDSANIDLNQPQSITIEAIYALAWKKQIQQYTDQNGHAYVNINSIEYV